MYIPYLSSPIFAYVNIRSFSSTPFFFKLFLYIYILPSFFFHTYLRLKQYSIVVGNDSGGWMDGWMDRWERGRFGFRAGFIVVQERWIY